LDSLLPLGRLPPDWPHQGDRNPAALFPLGTDDGLAHWVLVVTGPERGRVWLVTDVGAYPYPLPKALGFLDLRPVAALSRSQSWRYASDPSRAWASEKGRRVCRRRISSSW
jgi:hypothetical protein